MSDRRRVHGGVGSYIGASLEVAIGRNPAVLSRPDRLYLDHAATTPVLPEARAAMGHALEAWANPSSPHADGRKARETMAAHVRAMNANTGYESGRPTKKDRRDIEKIRRRDY